MRILMAPALALLLAACGSDEGGEGTSITLNASDGAGQGVAAKDGRVTIDTPVFQGSFKLPKIKLDADDFEMNGVKLPPGSTIGAMNIDCNSEGENDGQLRVSFRSPMTAPAARDWFAPKLKDAGYTLQGAGNALTGKTNEGKPFTLSLKDATPGASEGVITIGG